MTSPVFCLFWNLTTFRASFLGLQIWGEISPFKFHHKKVLQHLLLVRKVAIFDPEKPRFFASLFLFAKKASSVENNFPRSSFLDLQEILKLPQEKAISRLVEIFFSFGRSFSRSDELVFSGWFGLKGNSKVPYGSFGPNLDNLKVFHKIFTTHDGENISSIRTQFFQT